MKNQDSEFKCTKQEVIHCSSTREETLSSYRENIKRPT